MSGELTGAYALSESGAGSDALGAKARATRDADGSYVLNGEKMWITNGGFADVYIVFAKVDGEHFTAFIVERKWPGVSRSMMNAENFSPSTFANTVKTSANPLLVIHIFSPLRT